MTSMFIFPSATTNFLIKVVESLSYKKFKIGYIKVNMI